MCRDIATHLRTSWASGDPVRKLAANAYRKLASTPPPSRSGVRSVPSPRKRLDAVDWPDARAGANER
jgi:hypothetical protein